MPLVPKDSVVVALCKDAEDACRQGYDYKGTKKIPVQLDKIVVVQNGTVGGHSTLDLLLSDEDGNEYVALTKGSFFRTLPLR